MVFLSVFLLNGISRVRFRLLGVRTDLHFRALDGEFGVLLGDLLFGLYLDGVCLLLRVRSRDGDIPLCVCLRDLRVFADLLHIVDSHVFDGAGVVFEILDVEVHHLDFQLFHVRYDVFGDFFGDALAVLHHFFQSDGAHDLAHVALEHLGDQADELVLPLAEERFRRAVDEFGIGGNFDVRHAVHVDVDEFVGGDGFRSLDIHLHDAEGKFIHPLEEQKVPARFTDQICAFSPVRR